MDYGAEEYWPDLLSQEISNFGVRTIHMEADLSDSTTPYKIMNTVQEKLGTPSILINNATHDISDGFRKLNAQILDDHYNVNVRGTLLLSVEFAKQFEKKYDKHYGGRIINLISYGALIDSLGRLGLPEDAARLVKFLACEESQWITGQLINSEGGFING